MLAFEFPRNKINLSILPWCIRHILCIHTVKQHTAWNYLQDYEGQKRAEQLFQVIIILFGVSCERENNTKMSLEINGYK